MGELLLMDGRIALNGWANCNSPLHVRYPNVGKYYMQIASRAWYEGVCVCRRGELQFAHTTICPYCKIHPCCKFVHTPIRLHCISPILRIHPCGRANCNSPLRVCFLDVGEYHVNTEKDVMGMVWICLCVL